MLSCNFTNAFIKNNKFRLNFCRRFSEGNEDLVKLFKSLNDAKNKNQFVNFSFDVNKYLNSGRFGNGELERSSVLLESDRFLKCVGDNTDISSQNSQFQSNLSYTDICRENKELIIKTFINLLNFKTKNYNLVSFLCDSLNSILDNLNFKEIYQLLNSVLKSDLGDCPVDDRIFSLFQTLLNKVNYLLNQSLFTDTGIVKVNELPKYFTLKDQIKSDSGIGINLNSSIHLEKLWHLWYKLSTSHFKSEYRYTISLLLSVLEQQSELIFQFDLGRVTRTLDTLVGNSRTFSKLDEKIILKLFKRFAFILSDIKDNSNNEKDLNLYIRKNNITLTLVKKLFCNLSSLSKTTPKVVFDVMKIDKFYLSFENFIKISRLVFENEFSKVYFTNLTVGTNQYESNNNNKEYYENKDLLGLNETHGSNKEYINNSNTINKEVNNIYNRKDNNEWKEGSNVNESNKDVLGYVHNNLEQVRLYCSKFYLKILTYSVDILKIVDYMRLEETKFKLPECSIKCNIDHSTETSLDGIIDSKCNNVRNQLIEFSQELISNIYIKNEDLMLTEARNMYYLLLSSYFIGLGINSTDSVDKSVLLGKVVNKLKNNNDTIISRPSNSNDNSNKNNTSNTINKEVNNIDNIDDNSEKQENNERKNKETYKMYNNNNNINNNKDSNDNNNNIDTKKLGIKSVQYLLYCDKINSLLKELNKSSENILNVEILCKRLAKELSNNFKTLLSFEENNGFRTLYVTLMNKYGLLSNEMYYEFLKNLGNFINSSNNTNLINLSSWNNSNNLNSWNNWKVHEVSMLCDLFTRTYSSLFNENKEILSLVTNVLDSLLDYYLLNNNSSFMGNREFLSFLNCLNVYSEYIRTNEFRKVNNNSIDGTENSDTYRDNYINSTKNEEIKEDNRNNKEYINNSNTINKEVNNIDNEKHNNEKQKNNKDNVNNRWKILEKLIGNELKSRLEDMNFKQLIKILKLNNINIDKELENDTINRIFSLNHLGDISCLNDIDLDNNIGGNIISSNTVSSNLTRKNLVSRILSEYNVKIVNKKYMLFEKLLKYKYMNKFNKMEIKDTYCTQQTYDLLSKYI